MYTRKNNRNKRKRNKRTIGKYRGGDWKDKWDEMVNFLGEHTQNIVKNVSDWYAAQAWLNWFDVVLSTIGHNWETWMKDSVLPFWEPIKDFLMDIFSNKDSKWTYILSVLGVFGLIDWAGSAGLFGTGLEINLFDMLNNNYLNLGALIQAIGGFFLMLQNVLGWVTYGLWNVVASNGLFLSSFWIVMSITIFAPVILGIWDWINPNLETNYVNALENVKTTKAELEKAESELAKPTKKKLIIEDIYKQVKDAKLAYKKALDELDAAINAWETSKIYGDKLEIQIKNAEEELDIAKKAKEAHDEEKPINKKANIKKSAFDEHILNAETKLQVLQKLLKEYNDRLAKKSVTPAAAPAVAGPIGSNKSAAAAAAVPAAPSTNPVIAEPKNDAKAEPKDDDISSIASSQKSKSSLASKGRKLFGYIMSGFKSSDAKKGGRKGKNGKKGGNGKSQKNHGSSDSSDSSADLESVIKRLLSKKAIDKLNKTPKSVVDEMREYNPFPFQIAILCGFIKENPDGYEFVEEKMNKLKEPIIQSLSILNTRCKGEDCNEKTNKRVTQKDRPITSDEIEGLGEALTAIKLVHTASIHAIARESVESETKSETKDETKGGGRKIKPANVSKSMSHLKAIDTKWLENAYPDDFKIANKLGIVKQGNFTNVTNNILTDSAELAQKVVNRNMPDIVLAQ
jgi:hypothetical protein